MQTIEVKHHTPEAVRLYIDQAEQILTDCGYDDAERLALLPTIINLLSAKSVTLVAEPSPVMPAMAIPGRRH